VCVNVWNRLSSHFEQIDVFETGLAGGAVFNQPQHIHLKEALAAVMAHLEGLQVRCAAQHDEAQCT
jgi:uncharacterized protein (DUF1501 family)